MKVTTRDLSLILAPETDDDETLIKHFLWICEVLEIMPGDALSGFLAFVADTEGGCLTRGGPILKR